MNSKPREAPHTPELLINLCSPSAELRARLQLLTRTEEGLGILFTPDPCMDQSIDLYLIPVSRLSLVDRIRSFSPKPIIAYGPSGGLSAAFRRGCTDYLKDPWDEHELLLRSYRFSGPLRIIYPWGEVRVEHNFCRGPAGSVLLRPGEETILRTLIRHRGEAVSRTLLLNLLDPDLKSESRAADMHISLLRKKMRKILPPRVRTIILTARPRGYMLR